MPDHGSAALFEWAPALLVASSLAACYLLLLRRRRAKIPRSWNPWRTGSWLIGCGAIGIGLSPLLHGRGAVDHMAQHLLLGMYGPILLVSAAPVTVLLGAAGPRLRSRLGIFLASRPIRVLSHPGTAALLHTGPLFLLYLTALYGLAMTVPLWHWLFNLHFVAAGCLYAWAIAGPDPAPHRPGFSTRIIALLISAGAHAWLSKFIYAGAEKLPPAELHPSEEIESAAQLMYYGGDGAELILAIALFSAWYSRQRRIDAARKLSRLG